MLKYENEKKNSPQRRRARRDYAEADGTTVTVDWNTNAFAINPALSDKL
jgi:hypothetical protein